MKAGKLLRTCTQCGAERSAVTHFYEYGGKRERRVRSICKTCHAANGSAARKRRWKQYKAQQSERYYASQKLRAYQLWHRAKRRAEVSNLEFSLTRSWVEELLAYGVCQVTGIAFDLSKSTRTRQNPLCPTIDRINPALGYTPSNSRMVTWIYNRAKGDGTDAEVLAFAKVVLNALN